MEKIYHCECDKPDILHNDQEICCTQCGFVWESSNIQSENNKIIEEKGVFKKIFVNNFNPYQNFFLNSDPNHKRHKNVKEILHLCEKFFPLQKHDIEDLQNQIEKYYLTSKESCHNIKALVASAFYIKCNENKRFINLKDFLKDLNIKHKHFFKYHENLKRVIPLSKKLPEKNENDFEEIFERLFQKFISLIGAQKFEKKNFDMITNLYKPPSNFSKNHQSLFFVKFYESSELMMKTKNLIYLKTKFLYNISEIQFLKNGKSPINFISAILVLIFQSFDLKLTKNEFSSLFEIPYCTLSRIIKEIEICLFQKYDSLGIKDANNNECSTENNKSDCEMISENFEKIDNNEKKDLKKEKQNENKRRKSMLQFILRNLQNLFDTKNPKETVLIVEEEEEKQNSLELLIRKKM